MRSSLSVRGFGALTAVGWTAAQTCAAIRATITGFADSEFFQNTEKPVPLRVARAPFEETPANDNDFNRLVRMAVHAVSECLGTSGVTPSRAALVLGVREPYRHYGGTGGESEILAGIERAMRVKFHPDSCVIAAGNAAALRGLGEGRLLISTGRVEACIVGGVDSYLNPTDLTRFEDAYRLKRDGVAQGFIPGEGAAFVAVSGEGRVGQSLPIEITGIGWAEEDPSRTVLSDGHPSGLGLKQALKATLEDAQLPESSVAFRISDMNGEYYRGVESMFVQSRFYKTHREQLEMWLPSACVGEIGAAVGALLVIVAAVGMVKGYAPGHLAMCETSSDTGLRAGCLVSRRASQE